MDELINYYVVQHNEVSGENLGVNVDITNAVYMVEENRARRFDSIEDAQKVAESLNNILTVTKASGITYKLIKETREYYDGGVSNESTTTV